MNHLYLLFTITLLVFPACTNSQSDNDISEARKNYSLEVVVDGLDNPWGMVWLPDGSMLITEKEGDLIHFKDGEKTYIENPPAVYAKGQGGFLDIELHPNYEQNGWIYMTYSSQEGEGRGGHTALMRAQLNGQFLANQQVLYKATPNTTKGVHWGSRIEFDNDGYLYFSIGERGARDDNPQDITRDGGKIYRLHDDGTIPSDNPFYNEKGAKKAIYSYGHRNPQGMVLHPETGKIWTHEHGPRGGDEINIIKKGANYGWPEITYGINYIGTKITDKTSAPGMEQPLHYWTPSIAPCGMTFVTSDRYPEWKGDLLVGSLKFMYLERLDLEKNKVVKREKLATSQGRIRNVRQGPDGYIYIGVVNRGILRLVPE